MKYTVISKIFKISEKSNGRIIAKYLQFSFQAVQFKETNHRIYNNLSKDLEPELKMSAYS